MSEIELIAAALAAGALAGATGAANDAVRDAYSGLRSLLRRRLAGRPAALEALEAEVRDRNEWIARIGADVLATGADRDDEILAAARRIIDEERRRPIVDIHHNQGFTLGNYNQINQTFNG